MGSGTNPIAFLVAAYVVMIGGTVGYAIWLAVRWHRVRGSKP